MTPQRADAIQRAVNLLYVFDTGTSQKTLAELVADEIEAAEQRGRIAASASVPILGTSDPTFVDGSLDHADASRRTLPPPRPTGFQGRDVSQ